MARQVRLHGSSRGVGGLAGGGRAAAPSQPRGKSRRAIRAHDRRRAGFGRVGVGFRERLRTKTTRRAGFARRDARDDFSGNLSGIVSILALGIALGIALGTRERVPKRFRAEARKRIAAAAAAAAAERRPTRARGFQPREPPRDAHSFQGIEVLDV